MNDKGNGNRTFKTFLAITTIITILLTIGGMFMSRIQALDGRFTEQNNHELGQEGRISKIEATLPEIERRLLNIENIQIELLKKQADAINLLGNISRTLRSQ